MKIAIAQTISVKGDIAKNTQQHLELIQQAVAAKASAIFFPELSLTNYESELAKSLALTKNSPELAPFQAAADEYNMLIGVGAPSPSRKEKPHISLFIFQPQQELVIYSKILLHESERPYFSAGGAPLLIPVKGHKIALGICYESLQPAHLQQSCDLGATVFVASVAKDQKSVKKAYNYFPKAAQKYKIPILMANCIGPCDTFVGAGQSTTWNDQGVVVDKLDQESIGILTLTL